MKSTGPLKPKRFFDFGRFRLDPFERILLADGKPVAMTLKAFDTLRVLVENRGSILEKEELLKRVWTDTFVEERTLAQNISTLRKLLGEAPDGPKFIETIPRRGYRFVAEVHEASDTRVAEPRRSASNFLIAGGLVAVVLLLAGWLVRGQFQGFRPTAREKSMLVVLPFVNLSGDPNQDYFSSGLTEEMITQLGKLDPSRLGVIARTSAYQYQNAGKDIRQLGQELGVEYVLEGSVRQEGERVRIAAKLIQVKDQSHLWAADFDRRATDILDLQREVASAVAREIKLELAPATRAALDTPAPVDPEAHELYLRGRYFWNKRTEEGYLKAIECFNGAIAREPQYAEAYAGLADAYALLGSLPNARLPRGEAMPKAKASALRSLQLDNSLAEAHTSLGFVKMQYEWDWPDAEREFHRALDLNPSYATAHQWYAIWLFSRERPGEALEEEIRAQRADPLSLIVWTDTSQFLLCLGRYDDAIKSAQKAVEMDPSFPMAHYYLGQAYVGQQRYSEGIAELKKALTLSGSGAWALTALARAYAYAGQRHDAQAILQRMLKGIEQRPDLAFQVAQICLALDDKVSALAWLQTAYQYRDGGMILLNLSLEFAALRHDPEFADLERRVGLAVNRR